MATDLKALADEIESQGAGLSATLAERAASAIRQRHPGVMTETDTNQLSVEALLHLTDQLVPGWSILLRGKAHEPDGHWSCMIRESMTRDSDEFIGRGKAPDLASALLAAILRVLAYQSRPNLMA